MKRLTLILILATLILSCTKNTRPVASITVNPPIGATGTLFTFDASECSDAETCPCELCFRWDWESDGRWDTEFSKSSISAHRFKAPAIYNVKLEVADEEGLTDQATVSLLITSVNQPPVAVLRVTPESGNITEDFNFDGSGCHDPETPASELLVRWDWTNDGNWDTGFSTIKTASHRYTEWGTYTASLEVKDPGGLTGTSSVILTVGDVASSFTDRRDGHVYKYIKIGQQVWMAENLAYLPAVSSPSVGSDWADTLKYYYVFGYEGTSVLAAKQTATYLTYGVLYNWPAASTACPAGWHLPADKEWTTLTDFLGVSAGSKMKEAGYDHWDKPNTGATNESGFTALAGGHRNYDGDFHDLWIDTNFWTSTIDDAKHSWGRYLGYTYTGVSRFNYYTNYGFSVRCVKDE